MSRRRTLSRGTAVLAGLALMPAAAAASTASGPPLHRAMGCYSYAFGSLQFSQAVELLSARKYGLAPDIHHHRPHGAEATGRYTRNGNTLTFRTGAWAKLHLTGLWTPQKKDAFGHTIAAGLAIYKAHHVLSGVKCYPG